MSTKKANVVKKATTKTSSTKPTSIRLKDDFESSRDRTKIKKEELSSVKKSSSKNTVNTSSTRVNKTTTQGIPKPISSNKDGTSKTIATKEGTTKVSSSNKISTASKITKTASKTKDETTKIASGKDGTTKPRREGQKLSSTSKSVDSSRSKILTTKKTTVPNSPTSSRVTKSEFYPSKNMYSNALKDADVSIPKPATKITKSTTRIDSKSKIAEKPKLERPNLQDTIKEGRSRLEVPKETKQINVNTSERPRTATLRKGSIVNMNIAGPDISRELSRELSSLDLKKPKPETKPVDVSIEDSNNDYDDDDFDSYASDFDVYQPSENTSSTKSGSTNSSSKYDDRTNGEITSSSSSEELYLDKDIEKQVNSADDERTLDSGNFEMPENKHKQILDNIKESVEQEHGGLSSDEGFEESSLQYINFLGAVKKCQVIKPVEKKHRRGDDLMSMISLDSQNVTIFQLKPVSYDVFIKSFGNRHSMQVAAQTGDDDVSEECQTDLIETTNRWTQFPTKFSKINETDDFYLEKYRNEYMGAGADELATNITETDEKQNTSLYIDKNSVLERKKINEALLKYNENHLTKFIKSAGQLILDIMQETNFHSVEIVANDEVLPFSDGFIPLNTNFLKNRPILCIAFSDNVLTKILSVHGTKLQAKIKESAGDSNSTTSDNEIDGTINFRSLGCVWNLTNPGVPQQIFCTFGDISACCFGLENCHLIFAGLQDGTVSIWDLNQSPRTENYININQETKIQLKTVDYSTDVNLEFCNKIVSIQSCYEFKDDVLKQINENWASALQVITLNEIGTIVIWGFISKSSTVTASKHDQLSLVLNFTISLSSVYPDMTELQCSYMNINLKEPNHIYVATNYGNILHCLRSGAKVHPRKYTPEITCPVNCLVSSPHSPDHFLAGYENGNISLYSRLQEYPLITMCSQEDNNKIEIIAWSQSRPCMFYAKDSKNNIHLWDLTVSDLFPIRTIPFKEQIDFLKLSPINNKDIKRKRLYMAIVTKDKEILLHVLNSEHGQQTVDIDNSDMKMFLNYVKLL